MFDFSHFLVIIFIFMKPEIAYFFVHTITEKIK